MAETVADIAIGVTADIGPLMRETARAEAAMGRFGRVMNGIGASFSRFGKSATDLGGKMSIASAAITAAGAAALALTKNAADMGDAIDNGAKAAGLSTTAYQEYGYALSQAADMTGDEFAAAMVKMNKLLGEAKSGSESATEAFGKLGISAEDIANGTVTSDDALAALVTTLENTTDPAIAAAVASEILGKSGARMGGLLANTAGNVDDLRQNARDLGIVMSGEAVEASAKFNDKWDDVILQLNAVKIAIATSLMPIIVDKLIPALQEVVIPAIVSVINTLGEWITAFTELPGPVQEAIGLVAGLFAVGGPLLVAIGVASSVIGALVAATGPIGLLIAAAGLLTAAWTLWGNDFKAIVGGAIDWVTTKFDAFMGLVDSIIAKLTEWKNTAKEFLSSPSGGAPGPDGGAYSPTDQGYMDPMGGIGGVSDLGGGAGSDTLGVAIADGMVNGMAARLAERSEEIGAIVDTIPQIARDRLGIQSPSTVFAEIGENIGLGMAEGILASQAAVQASMAAVNGGILGDTANLFNGLATITQAGGEKANRAYRAFAAGEALINAYRAASQALATPGITIFGKFAAYASVLAAGMNLVSAIKGGGSGGGSARAPSGSSASAAPASTPLEVRLTGFGPDDLISGSMVSSLLDRLSAEAGDRGYRIMTAAT